MFFFVISMIMYLVQNFSNKQFSERNKNSASNTALVQNALCTFSSALVLAIFGGVKLMPLGHIFFAVIFGAFYLLTVFLLLKAFTLGSMGASTLLCNIGSFVSALYGILRFGDDFSTYIAIGTCCILGAVILSTPRSNDKKSGSLKWFTFAIASGLSNGIISSIKRESVAMTDDIRNFLVWGFFFASLIATFILLTKKQNHSSAIGVLKNPALVLFGIGAGIGTAGGNLFQMLALKTVSSAIIYPFTAGFITVSLWLVSLLIYKETTVKLRNILSLILCIAAIILINL